MLLCCRAAVLCCAVVLLCCAAVMCCCHVCHAGPIHILESMLVHGPLRTYGPISTDMAPHTRCCAAANPRVKSVDVWLNGG
jgi:hypothetical protein